MKDGGDDGIWGGNPCCHSIGNEHQHNQQTIAPTSWSRDLQRRVNNRPRTPCKEEERVVDFAKALRIFPRNKGWSAIKRWRKSVRSIFWRSSTLPRSLLACFSCTPPPLLNTHSNGTILCRGGDVRGRVQSQRSSYRRNHCIEKDSIGSRRRRHPIDGYTGNFAPQRIATSQHCTIVRCSTHRAQIDTGV